MANFRYNLDKRFLDKESSDKGRKLELEGKAFNKYLNPKETSIYLSVSINHRYIKVNTGQKIEPKWFDLKNQKIKQHYNGALEFNILLERIKTDCLKGYRQLLTETDKISSDDVKKLMYDAINPKASSEKSFIELFEEFYEKHKLKVEATTAIKYKITLTVLEEYERMYPKIQLANVNQSFADNFSDFLIETRNNSNNTIVKHLKNIKCFMRDCVKNGLTDNHLFKDISTGEDPSTIFVLTEEELMSIYNLELESKTLIKVRDVFCFQTFTGQRFGDVKALKWKDIKIVNGQMFWVLHQLKTKDTRAIRIPILPLAKEILERYKPLNPEPHQHVFSTISNVKTNKYLKDLGADAGLDDEITIVRKQGFKRVEETMKRYQKLTTHTARKTFISLSIQKGMSVPAVQRISGHSSMKAMKPYIELSQQFVKDELFSAWQV